jgi:tetratricopeptide (TPR) repeat protein
VADSGLPAWAVAIRRARAERKWSRSRLAYQIEQAIKREGKAPPSRVSLVRMIRAWERGDHKPDQRNRELLAAAFDLPQEALFGRSADLLAEIEVTSPEAWLYWYGRLVAAVEAGDGDMRRREFLRELAAMVSGLALEVPGLQESAERVVHALAKPVQIDAATVADMETITAGYRRSYRHLSVQVLLPQAQGQANLVKELLRGSATPQLRDRLVTTLSEAEALVGVMKLMDLFDFDDAWFHLSRALHAAREAQAAEHEAFILGCMGFNACYSGDRRAAFCLIESARHAARTTYAPLTRGWLAAVDAEIQSRAGHAAACLAALESAEEALNEAGDAEAPWIGVGVFNRAKLASYYGGCYYRLQRPQEAIGELVRSLNGLEPSMQKHRCNAMAELALAFGQLREVEESCRYASDALSIAASLRHAATIDRIRRMRGRMDPSWENNAAVRLLDDQLRLSP